MTKLYVVNHIGSEYNDEVYTLLEGGTPVRVFVTETKANEFARIANEDEIAEVCFSDWGYSAEDVTNLDEAGFNARVCAILGVENHDVFEHCDLSEYDLSREQKGQLAELVNLKFYEVVEVEGG